MIFKPPLIALTDANSVITPFCEVNKKSAAFEGLPNAAAPFQASLPIPRHGRHRVVAGGGRTPPRVVCAPRRDPPHTPRGAGPGSRVVDVTAYPEVNDLILAADVAVWEDPDGHMLEIITVPYGG